MRALWKRVFPHGSASLLVHRVIVTPMKLIDEFRHGWQGISQPSPQFSVGFAAGCLVLATLSRWGLAQIRPDVFFTPYIPAVFFASAVSGLRTGVITAIIVGVLGVVVNFGNTSADTARIALLLIFWLVRVRLGKVYKNRRRVVLGPQPSLSVR